MDNIKIVLKVDAKGAIFHKKIRRFFTENKVAIPSRKLQYQLPSNYICIITPKHPPIFAL